MEKKGDVYSFESGAFVGVMVFMTAVDRHLMATASRAIHHGPNLISSGFRNMAMCSLYSSGLHSHHISSLEHL